MLTATDIAEMRAVAKEAMPDRVRIYRPSTEEDPMGGLGGGLPALIGEEDCAFSTSLSSSALVGDDQRTSADGVFTLPGDTTLDVRPQDKAQLVGGPTYEVQGYLERGGRFEITKRVLVART
jgi:hypothetical protein